jgi:hypothetical protein
MKKLIFASFAFALLVSTVSLAQDTTNQDNTKATAQENQEHKPSMPTKSVTGCLQKGDEQGEFSITGADGKTWGLRSKNVKLEQHVGHQVTVTGSAHHESKAEEKSEEKKEGHVEKASGKEEYGDLSVSDLKMVSDTCTK